MVGEGPQLPPATRLPLPSPTHMANNKIGETRVVLSAFPLNGMWVSSSLGLTPLWDRLGRRAREHGWNASIHLSTIFAVTRGLK